MIEFRKHVRKVVEWQNVKASARCPRRRRGSHIFVIAVPSQPLSPSALQQSPSASSASPVSPTSSTYEYLPSPAAASTNPAGH